MKCLRHAAVAASLLFGLIPIASAAAPQTPPFVSCRGFISGEFIRSHGWVQFYRGRVSRFDPAKSLLTVDHLGKQIDIYLIPDTEICRDDRPSSVREIRLGDRVGGYYKKIDGRNVGMELGFGKMGEVYPFGIPLPGAIGLIKSPFAFDKPAIKIDPNTPTGTLIKCPYTGKMFQMPLTPLQWTNHSGGGYYRK